MKKAKTFIIPMLALAAFGLVACGGGQSSSSQQQSSSDAHASIDVDKIASVEITNKDAMKKDWPINEGSRTLAIKVLNTEGKRLSETVLIGTGELKITTSNAEVADVVGAGVFAKAAGKATITVTCKGKTDTVEVNVVAPKVAQSVAATLQQIANLAQDETFPEAIMTKGVVKEITAAWDAGYGNISFKIKDADADNELLCYRVVPAEGIDGSKIKVGDEVVINGKIKNYKGTLEYDAGAAIQEWKDGGQQVIVVKNIADVKAGDSVELTGTVAAISKKAFVLTDGTASIYVYANAVPAIGTGDDQVNLAVGDVIKLTGTAAEYHGFVQIGNSGLAMEKVEGTPAAVTPTALTAEGANALKTAAAFTGYKAYSWTAKAETIDGQLCANVDGSDIKIQIPNSNVDVQVGKTYNFTGFFAAYDTKYDYALMVPMAAEEYHSDVSSVAVTGPTSVRAEESIYLFADCLPENAPQDVIWSSENPAIATVNAKGKVTGVAEGTVKIYATAFGTDIKDFIEITVGAKSAIPAEDVSVVSYPEGLNPGKSGLIVASVAPEGASTNLVYTSSDEEIAVVDEDGIVTAKAIGKVTITVSAKDVPTVKREIVIDVHAACLGDIQQGLVKAGDALELDARVMFAPANPGSGAYNIVIWDGTAGTVARLNKGIAVPTVGSTIKINGKVATYNGGYQLDSTASADLVGESSASIPEPIAVPIPAEAAAQAYEFAFGENPQLIPASGMFELDECVITGGSGNYIYFDFHGTPMETTIQGLDMKVGHTYKVEGFFYGTYTSGANKYLTFVPLKANEVEDTVYIDSTVNSVEEKKTIDIIAKTAGNTDDTYNWVSSDTSVATVDANGKVTGVKAGKTTITATSVANPARSASVEVTVTPAPAASYVSKAKYTFTNTHNSTAVTDGNTIKGWFTKASGDGIVSSVSNPTKVYPGANGGNGDTAWNLDNALKIGSSSAGGTVKITLSEAVSKVVITGYGWKNSIITTINGVDSDSLKANLANKTNVDANNVGESSFILSTPATELTISTNSTSIVITAIEFFVVGE
ncbi:MAG: Ig-like domain-containing protein [Bacilli bacterium]|nr:Ig-like domain-containing protein [Bacilli bacterium]